MARLSALAAVLFSLLSAPAALAQVQCDSEPAWCGGYAPWCGDAFFDRACPRTCRLCAATWAGGSTTTTSTGRPAATATNATATNATTTRPPPTGCGGGSPSYPPALRFDGDEVLGIAQGISGGAEAAQYSYPFIARLLNPHGGRCTASIIGEQWVLTAAHCVATASGRPKGDAARFAVYAAAHGRHGGQRAGVRSVLVHEEYGGACKRDGTDIALVRLSDGLNFTDKVQPVCLPDAGDDFTGGSTEKMVAAGWGWRRQDEPAAALQHAVFSAGAATQRLCHRHGSREMCAWGGRRSAACPGDSGGPLFFKRGGRWTQAGIAVCASGPRCESQSVPNTYVHVPAHREWIRQKTGL